MSLDLRDKLTFKDKICTNVNLKSPKSGLWAKTEVLCSNGDVIINPNGKSSFAPGCPFTKRGNMVPIGGVEYVMEQLFGVPGTQFEVPTLYQESGIGLPNSLPPTETYRIPDTEKGQPQYKSILYRYGHLVQLFGIGITGTAENDVTVYPVNYRENSINLSMVTQDGLTLTGTMLPFRYTNEQLSSVERQMYFGKKTTAEGVTCYYLKRFESDPVIKHTWKTGEDYNDGDETLVSSSDVWDNKTGLNAVESFTEIILKVSKKDVKEWFIELEQEDRTRINTIALFNGRFVKNDEDPTDYGDYEDVRLFSKLNIPVEYLSLSKDLNIIYRIYGA